MMMQEKRVCPHCKEIFYVNGLRYTDAKTLSCYHCNKRFKVQRGNR